MIEIFLLPFTLLKWIFSLAFWYFTFYVLTNTETYESVSDSIKDRWNEYRNKQV